mgnify:CR=1 FL=1
MSLIADVRINNQYIRVINNHFETTSVNAYRGIITAPGKSLEVRAKAVKDLILKMKIIIWNEQNKPIQSMPRSNVLLIRYWFCGDFNDTPASYTYHQLRKGLTDGFRDCGSGYQYTFRQLYKLWRIDYVFYSEFLKGQDCFSPDAPYSDHNMVVWRGILLK